MAAHRWIGLLAAAALGATVLAVPTTATAAGACSAVERMVWTGDDATTKRQVVVGTPGSSATTIASAGVSTNNSDPVISPDGHRIAWTGKVVATGQFEVLVADADGSRVRRVAPGVTAESWTHLAEGVAPDWAPFGERITWAGSARTSIHIADLTGSPVETISSPASASSPQWSPDGFRVAWLTTDLPAKVLVAAAQSGASVQAGANVVLLNGSLPNGFAANVAWAPDGRHIALHTVEDPTSFETKLQPAVLDVETGAVTVMGAGFDYYPDLVGVIGYDTDAPQWTRTGDALAWSRTHRSTGSLLGETQEGGQGDVVGAGMDRQLRQSDLGWSPDGGRTVGSSWGAYSSAMSGSASSGKILVTDRSGTETNLSHWLSWGPYRRVDVAPAWSPRGDRIAWEAQKHTFFRLGHGTATQQVHQTSRLAIRAADRSTSTTLLGPGGAPEWSPNGHFIGTSLNTGPDLGVRSYDSYTGAATTFVGPTGKVRRVAWTAAAATNLQITATPSASEIDVGARYELDIEVVNWGPCGADDVAVVDVVRPGMFVGASHASHGSLHSSVWALGRMPSGSSARLHLELLAPASPTTIRGWPIVTAGTTDPVPYDNTAHWQLVAA